MEEVEDEEGALAVGSVEDVVPQIRNCACIDLVPMIACFDCTNVHEGLDVHTADVGAFDAVVVAADAVVVADDDLNHACYVTLWNHTLIPLCCPKKHYLTYFSDCMAP